jgi:hypothetical protein
METPRTLGVIYLNLALVTPLVNLVNLSLLSTFLSRRYYFLIRISPPLTLLGYIKPS